jgi:NAD(P)-dependent dehydrogenase (short-subunit alcohol dehydrogenase family)
LPRQTVPGRRTFIGIGSFTLSLDEVLAYAKKIDVLFNNAATILPKALEDVREQEWTLVVDINLKSVYLMIKYTIPGAAGNRRCCPVSCNKTIAFRNRCRAAG